MHINAYEKNNRVFLCVRTDKGEIVYLDKKLVEYALAHVKKVKEKK